MVLFVLQEGEGHSEVTPEPTGGRTDPRPPALPDGNGRLWKRAACGLYGLESTGPKPLGALSGLVPAFPTSPLNSGAQHWWCPRNQHWEWEFLAASWPCSPHAG